MNRLSQISLALTFFLLWSFALVGQTVNCDDAITLVNGDSHTSTTCDTFESTLTTCSSADFSFGQWYNLNIGLADQVVVSFESLDGEPITAVLFIDLGFGCFPSLSYSCSSNVTTSSALTIHSGIGGADPNTQMWCYLYSTSPATCGAFTVSTDFIYEGCVDPTACNFDPEATAGGAPCFYPGCDDPSACNYHPEAICSGGSCEYPEAYLDCDGLCLNDENSNGICDEEEPCFGADCCAEGTFWDPFNKRCVVSGTCPADITGNGIVDAFDILALIAGYGVPCAP